MSKRKRARIKEPVPESGEKKFDDYMRTHMVKAGVAPEVIEAYSHPSTCKCDKCLIFWRTVGADIDGTYGPFTKEEILG